MVGDKAFIHRPSAFSNIYLKFSSVKTAWGKVMTNKGLHNNHIAISEERERTEERERAEERERVEERERTEERERAHMTMAIN